MRSCLKAAHLAKSYRGKKVVNDVSVEIRQGEIVGLLGPNGAGKTTTFSMILGLVPQDAGRIFLDDEDITDYPMYLRAQKGICLLPQESSAFRTLTVEDNLRAIMETLPEAPVQQASTLERTLGEFGLARLAQAKAFTLSGGERRRLEIARAMISGPEFMLLDEPFTGIDPIAIQELQRIIRSLQEKGLGVLITDHSVRETLKIVDRAYIIDKGRILKEGTPGEIVISEDVRRNYLGEDFRL
ncbi:MAG: LPS export ABC transporter ATP-binding protein [Candidatus Aminicenantes bacterium]|nr:LPS export ABC transporter ATP-binding protein [Candidatus Aminicenantes bacterium]